MFEPHELVRNGMSVCYDSQSEALICVWDFTVSRVDGADTRVVPYCSDGGHFGTPIAIDQDLFARATSCPASFLSDDDPLEIDEGTLNLVFVQGDEAINGPSVLVRREPASERALDCRFAIGVTEDGRIEVTHITGTADLFLRTPPRVFDVGDTVEVSYSWNAQTGATLWVTNTDTGSDHRMTFPISGLQLTVSEPVKPGLLDASTAKEREVSHDGTDWLLKSVAIFSKDIITEQFNKVLGDTITGNSTVNSGVGEDDRVFKYQGGKVHEGMGQRTDVTDFSTPNRKNCKGDDWFEGASRNELLDGVVDVDGCFGFRGHDHLHDTGRQDSVLMEGRKSLANHRTPVDAAVDVSSVKDASVLTHDGERHVKALSSGDAVATRDNGLRQVVWTGRKGLTGKQLQRNPHLKPVVISQGALGGGLPTRDLYLAPNQRVLVSNDQTALYFEEKEALVAAKHLTALEGVSVSNPRWATYYFFMFSQHETVQLNGVWVECFQPGDYSLKMVGNAQRLEIEELFPEFEVPVGRASYQAARRSLKKYELKRASQN